MFATFSSSQTKPVIQGIRNQSLLVDVHCQYICGPGAARRLCRLESSSVEDALTLGANVWNHINVVLGVIRIVAWMAACPFQSGWIVRAGDGWPRRPTT